VTDAKDPRGRPHKEPSDDEKLIDELIFRQYLDEVHLLMDFVSGRADRSLAALTMPNPTAPGETMSSGTIVGAISEMRYPPGEDSAVNARNAAIFNEARIAPCLQDQPDLIAPDGVQPPGQQFDLVYNSAGFG
jgi:hypothetical protein